MKATFEIPDDLYRSVKARSALEGRSLRVVAEELFRKWLNTDTATVSPPAVSGEELEKFPWLAYAAKNVSRDASHAMDDIRTSISKGWAAEATAYTKARSKRQ